MKAERTPPWPTTMKSRMSDGRLQGTDNSVWLYRAVPMGPVTDAKSPNDGFAVAETLLSAYDELASMTPINSQRRSVSKGNYRQTHVLLVNVPQLFEPPAGHPLSQYLSESFPDVITDRRLLLFGVRLKDKLGTGGFKSTVEGVVQTLVEGSLPLTAYDSDYAKVDSALSRAGLTVPTADDLRLANAWWNHGQNPDTPLLPHGDHIHVFTSPQAVNEARETGSVDNCTEWREEIADQHSISFAAVQDFDLEFIDPTSSYAHWASSLLDSRALVISIRGDVEPASVTRAELRRQRKRFIDDINERVKNGKMERQEQTDQEMLLGQVEGMYSGASGSKGTPTLTNCSVVVGFDGQVSDINQHAAHSAAKLNLMQYRQPNALAETWLCSPLRANPYLHDLPTQTVACSGIQSLNSVGDVTGAAVGFTERDRQIAWLSPTAASDQDSSPCMLVAGQTGSGKTLFMLNIASQFSQLGRSVVLVDPKADSDHSAVVMAAGGQVASLDDIASSDGVFDPLRFSHSQSSGIELAASMLMSVNPWGSSATDFETRLTKGLHYGVTNGAKCILQALDMARSAGLVGDDLVGPVEDLASSSAMFAAIAGRDPLTAGLSVAKGITLIKVGKAHLNLPAPGHLPDSQNQRVALALVRMMVFGSAMALTGQGGGVLCLDEAWTILSGEGGRAEIERLGRLARSQQVLPILFTQRVSDAVDAGLSGYISRGLILPIEDPYEANAACELFKLDPTPERISRITAKATMGSIAGGTAPNWNSMRALVDPNTRKVIRGAVGIYADLAGRAVPVEVTIPPEMVRLASTNPEDIRQRAIRKALEEGDLSVPVAPVVVADRPSDPPPAIKAPDPVADDWFDLPAPIIEDTAEPVTVAGFDADGWPT